MLQGNRSQSHPPRPKVNLMRFSVKYRTIAIVLVSLAVVYAVFGFFLLPSIVKPRLVKTLEETTHRPVRVGDLAINPFTLSVTVYDFELKDRDSTRLVSFARLHINYEIISLFQSAYVFSEFLLDTPYVALRVLRNGKLSVNDLMAPATADSAAAAGPVKALVIDNFALTQGRIVLEDLSRKVPMRKDIDSLNLSLKNFTTKPREEGVYEFTAATGGGEYLHWRGTMTVTPARSAGLLEVRNLRASSLWEFMSDRLKFTIDSGLLDVRAEYDLDASRETPKFRLRNGSLKVSDLTLRDPNDSLPPVSLPVLGVSGMAYEYPAQTLTLDHITVEGGELRTAYLADGTITLQDLLTPIPDPADTSHTRIQMTINRITTSGTKFVLIEKMLEPEAPMVLTDLALDLKNFCYGKPGTAQIDGRGVLNSGGTVSASGTLSLDPRKADLDIRVAGTPFVALQPYASRYSRARHESGTASLQGKISYASRNGRTMFRFRGGAALDRVRISDPVMNEDLTRWDRLELKGIDYTLTPPAMSVAEIVATRPYVRVIIAADRTMNIQHVMAQGADSTARAVPAAAPRDSTQHTATTIKGITIVDGSMNFTDLSLTPNFAVSIQEMGGTVRGLSSEQVARADVEIAGKVDKYAPATIRGQINPLSEEAYTDILMKFEGIELTTFTPYAGKFAGYKIDRGKLNLDLRYKLNKRYLEGSNKIVLDQLTLGEEMPGPDVTSMPVKLAIALLKDSHGVIDLDIPVSGSIDDPEFSLFPVILKAILNVLWKIVTAPFALLGSLFGGSGEELEYVAFLPGSDSLAADQQAKLTTIAKGLTDRPALQLDVRGSASNTADRDVIAENMVTKKIRTSGTGPLTPAEEKRLLTLYQQTFKEDATQLVPEGGMTAEERGKAVTEGAQRRLIGSVQVTESDLRDLAQRRAAAILGHLTRQGGVDVARMFLQEAETTVNPTEGMVRTRLSLTAR
jgi:hypothetical protein